MDEAAGHDPPGAVEGPGEGVVVVDGVLLAHQVEQPVEQVAAEGQRTEPVVGRAHQVLPVLHAGTPAWRGRAPAAARITSRPPSTVKVWPWM